jgi:hypothetical protein
MGIDTGCMLILGLPAAELLAGLPAELRDKAEDEGLSSVAEDLGLASASPSYDSPYDARIWGVCLKSEYWHAAELDPEALPGQITAAKAQFKGITGLEGRLFVSPHVT